MTSTPDNTSIAIYPGTFDPITNGHLDLITRGLCLFDKVIVTIAVNPGKEPLFSMEERKKMILDCFEHEERVEVDSVSGLLVEYAASRNARAIIRGLRAVSDFDYEFQLALMNRKLERSVESVFLMPGFRWIFISSSIVKDAARHGGNVEGLVPEHVRQMLLKKFQRS
jgi:pantetheine-phosphate adenylyltransferase